MQGPADAQSPAETTLAEHRRPRRNPEVGKEGRGLESSAKKMELNGFSINSLEATMAQIELSGVVL
jgi:hypothetical protein